MDQAKGIDWRTSSIWRTFGINAVLLVGLFVLLAFYSWFRKTYFQQPASDAFANALDIIELQRWLGLGVDRVELPMQEWVLERGSLIDFFNMYYRQFKPALYLFAILGAVLAPIQFRRICLVFLVATLIAFPMYAIYPLAPPRLMEPFGFPFVDTLAVFDGVQSSAEGAGGANQFAAMPSMHIGWTTVGVFWLVAALPRWRIGSILAVIHVVLMCVTVIVTGNHYWIDIVAGFAVAGSAFGIVRLAEIYWPESLRPGAGRSAQPAGQRGGKMVSPMNRTVQVPSREDR